MNLSTNWLTGENNPKANMNDGGPAFPFVSGVDDDNTHYSGMLLREYFAAKAMQAILPLTFETASQVDDVAEKAKLFYGVAPTAYEIANLMVKEMQKQP